MNDKKVDIKPEEGLALQRILADCDDFVVTSHNSPDGDALGSTAALCHYLVSKGKRCVLVLPDPVPAPLSFVFQPAPSFPVYNREDHPKQVDEALAGAGAIVCLDFNHFGRTKLGDALRACSVPKVLIDHHLNPDRASFTVCVSEVEVSSVCELLYYLLLSFEGNASALPPRCAYSLMVGMTTDSNNFANSVYPTTLRMASELMAAGVDREDIIDKIYHHYRENRLRALGYFLSEKLTLTPQRVAYVVFSQEDMRLFGLEEGETEGFVNQPLSLDAVDMSIFVREMQDRFRVSIRSKKGVSANALAKACFFGGGHENAAGGTLYKFSSDPKDRLGNPAVVEDVASALKYVQDAIVRYAEKK